MERGEALPQDSAIRSEALNSSKLTGSLGFVSQLCTFSLHLLGLIVQQLGSTAGIVQSLGVKGPMPGAHMLTKVKNVALMHHPLAGGGDICHAERGY